MTTAPESERTALIQSGPITVTAARSWRRPPRWRQITQPAADAGQRHRRATGRERLHPGGRGPAGKHRGCLPVGLCSPTA